MAGLRLVGRPQRNVRGQRPIRASSVGGSVRLARELYHMLEALIKPMVTDVDEMSQWLASNPGAATAANALMTQRDKWRKVLGDQIPTIVRTWAEAVDKRARERLEKNLAKALGVEYTTIFDDLAITDTVQMMGVQAVSLIESVPNKFFDQILQRTMEAYQQIPLPEGRSLTDEIMFLTGHMYEDAKLIAVDQTNKLHGMVESTRQQMLGIEEYYWRTARDSRVVGTPGGLYPKATKLHGNHYEREGVIYRWDSPPDDGHPGWPIRCRCQAQPRIIPEKLKLV